MSEFEKLRNRTILTCPLVRPGFWSLWTLGGSPPGFSVPSLTTQPHLRQINGTAGSWVFNWVFLMGRGWGWGGGLMRPGPVFILTFLPQLYRRPSSDLKGRYGLVGLPQRCQTSPSSSAACDIFTLMEYSHSRYTQSPVFPSPHGVLWQDEQDVLWWRCQCSALAPSRNLSEVVKPDIFHWKNIKGQTSDYQSQSRFCKVTTAEFLLNLLKLASSFQRGGTTMQVGQ